MTQYTSLFVLLVALSGALSQTAPTGNFFDCRRKGISCTDGTCEPAVGTACTCDASFISILDYNCVADAVEKTFCPNTVCQNGGTCFVEGTGIETCFCPQLYTGKNCELPRIELTCNPTAMTVTVRPHGTFGGAMYAKGHASNTNCVLAASGNDYVKAFAYNTTAVTNCGVVQSDLEEPVGTVIGTKYTLNVIVQYEITPDIVMGTDQELVATCSFPAELANSMYNPSGVIFESNATGNLDGGTGDAEGSPLVFDILGNDGVTSLTAAETVNVGEELTVTILLQTNAAYPEFLIDSCTAANGDDTTAADYDFLDFVTTGGCPTDNQVVRGDHTSETPATGTLVKIPLYAFMFVKGSAGNKNTLFFSCSVQLCDAAAVTAGTCNAPDPATCTGDFSAGLGKRRRRAADGDMRVVGQALTVRFGNATLEEEFRESSGSEQTGVETDTAKCLKNPELQTVISVLGIFLLVLLIALIVVTCLYCRRSCDTQGKYVDDGHTMGSSTQTLNMHIPRPRV